MAEVNEQTKPGPNGDTAATASWNKKLSALDKSSFPAKGPNSRKPPIDKAMNVTVEGKTFKDNKDDSKSSKQGRFAAIKAARDNKKKSQVQDEETLTSLDLVEAVIARKPGSTASIFDILMHEMVTDMVAERRLELAKTVFGEQEIEDEAELADEDAFEDLETEAEEAEEDAEFPEEKEKSETDESEGEVEEEEEEINELSAALKKRYAVSAKADVNRRADKAKFDKGHVRPGLAKRLQKRFDTAKKVSEEELTDPANNTKPHVHSTKSGNTEKKQHTQDTLNRLRRVSVTKTEKAAIKDLSN